MYINISLTKRIINQAQGQDGWILAKFSFCVFMAETKSRSIKMQKENKANI